MLDVGLERRIESLVLALKGLLMFSSGFYVNRPDWCYDIWLM